MPLSIGKGSVGGIYSDDLPISRAAYPRGLSVTHVSRLRSSEEKSQLLREIFLPFYANKTCREFARNFNRRNVEKLERMNISDEQTIVNRGRNDRNSFSDWSDRFNLHSSKTTQRHIIDKVGCSQLRARLRPRITRG